jgi:putative ABC transport system permease protein
MQNDHLGFRPDHSLTVRLRAAGFQDAASDALTADILADLRRIPGTVAAALTQCTPLSRGAFWITFSRSDRPLPEPFHRGDNIGVCGAGPDYLMAAGTQLVGGRFFTESDPPGTLAVINEAAARAYLPGEDAIGKQILGGRAGSWKTVIGVVADTKNQGLNQPPSPEALVNDTRTSSAANVLFIVRTIAGDRAFARALHDQLHADHPGIFTGIESLNDEIGEATASPRFNTVLLATFAGVAFLMAIVGVYGVLAFSVAQRSGEIGIRMALGATPGTVLALVMREGAALVAAGALAGVAGALVLTRYLATLLYGVTASDPVTYAAVVIGLALAASAAIFLPARRAARLDPVVALRHE